MPSSVHVLARDSILPSTGGLLPPFLLSASQADTFLHWPSASVNFLGAACPQTKKDGKGPLGESIQSVTHFDGPSRILSPHLWLLTSMHEEDDGYTVWLYPTLIVILGG